MDEHVRWFALGIATGMFAGVLLVTPLMLSEQRQEIQAAWDADVQAWAEQCDRAYQQGRLDAEEMQALAREVAP